MSRRAVFLDRDGVLNEPIIRNGKAYAPLSLEDFRLVVEAPVQVGRLRAAGLVCIVVTNQPEIASGELSPVVLEKMHRQLRERVGVDDIFVCVHNSNEGCSCHKPRPGMIKDAASRWDIDLGTSFMVGDRWRDIDAGRAAGCHTVLIARDYSQSSNGDAQVADLREAVDFILQKL
jgi:D-glycero-D-manno-heptose 1,7-bisphosphate phosphatase